MQSVFDQTNKKDQVENDAFLDDSGGVTIARFDKQKHPIFEKLTDDGMWR